MSFNYYENTNFVNNRNRKRTLILDVEDGDGSSHLGDGTEFNIQLYEPLRIDKHSEIYLDNFLTFNSNITNTASSAAFVLKINEFNMNSNVASTHGATTITSGDTTRSVPGGQRLFNSLIIPNEHKDPSNNHTTVVHKGKKFNYVCDINPQTITRLSGTITDLSGSPIFHGAEIGGRFTYALTGIVENLVFSPGVSSPLQPTDAITGITLGSNPPTSVTGNILFSTDDNASTIHFALAQDLDDGAIPTGNFNSSAGSIVFSLTRGVSTFTVTLTNAGNPNIQLIKGDGRFIAEFSIVSRE